MSTQSLQVFFTGKTFVVPEFQRDYAWSRANIDDLFDDITEALETGKELFAAWIEGGSKSSDAGGCSFRPDNRFSGMQRARLGPIGGGKHHYEGCSRQTPFRPPIPLTDAS
jgi:hypothetical protein